MKDEILNRINKFENPTVGIVLLSNDWYYISEEGKLPKRPSFDKELITEIARNKIILCSPNTHSTLPPSIKKSCLAITNNPESKWDVNFGIKTFSEQCDVFIVIKSKEDLKTGKLFNFERIINLYKDHNKDLISDNDCVVFIFSKK